MPVRISFTLTGADAVAGGLRDVAEKLRRPRGLQTAGDRLVEAIQRAIRGGAVPGPGLAPATIEDRRRKGFPAGPPLLRTGSLADAVSVLGVDSVSVDYGVSEDRAAPLHSRWPFLETGDAEIEPVLGGMIEEAFA